MPARSTPTVVGTAGIYRFCDLRPDWLGLYPLGAREQLAVATVFDATGSDEVEIDAPVLKLSPGRTQCHRAVTLDREA
jgi:hypothetical protein